MNAHPLMVSTQVTIARMLAHRCKYANDAPGGYSHQEREIRALAADRSAHGLLKNERLIQSDLLAPGASRLRENSLSNFLAG